MLLSVQQLSANCLSKGVCTFFAESALKPSEMKWGDQLSLTPVLRSYIENLLLYNDTRHEEKHLIVQHNDNLLKF